MCLKKSAIYIYYVPFLLLLCAIFVITTGHFCGKRANDGVVTVGVSLQWQTLAALLSFSTSDQGRAPRQQTARATSDHQLAILVGASRLEFQHAPRGPDALHLDRGAHRLAHEHGLPEVERLREVDSAREALADDRAKQRTD